jgi:hypothetical protein
VDRARGCGGQLTVEADGLIGSIPCQDRENAHAARRWPASSAAHPALQVSVPALAE